MDKEVRLDTKIVPINERFILLSTLRAYQKIDSAELEFETFNQADYQMEPIGKFIGKIIKKGNLKNITFRHMPKT